MNPRANRRTSRRTLLLSLLTSGLAPLACPAAAKSAPRALKITGVKALVTNPPQSRNENFVLVKIETSEPGIHGWGDAVREVFTALPEYAAGHVSVGDAPGLGIDVNERAAAKYPYKRFFRRAIRRADGTPWPY